MTAEEAGFYMVKRGTAQTSERTFTANGTYDQPDSEGKYAKPIIIDVRPRIGALTADEGKTYHAADYGLDGFDPVNAEGAYKKGYNDGYFEGFVNGFEFGRKYPDERFTPIQDPVLYPNNPDKEVSFPAPTFLVTADDLWNFGGRFVSINKGDSTWIYNPTSGRAVRFYVKHIGWEYQSDQLVYASRPMYEIYDIANPDTVIYSTGPWSRNKNGLVPYITNVGIYPNGKPFFDFVPVGWNDTEINPDVTNRFDNSSGGQANWIGNNNGSYYVGSEMPAYGNTG